MTREQVAKLMEQQFGPDWEGKDQTACEECGATDEWHDITCDTGNTEENPS